MHIRHWMAALILVAMTAGWTAENAGITSPDTVTLRSASLVVKVTSFSAAKDRIDALVLQHHGNLQDARVYVKPNGRQNGTLVIQVPRSEMDGLLRQLHDVGKLYSDSLQTRDQTSDYELLERRAALLQKNETELQAFLRSPRRMRGSDILYVQYRLYQTRMEMAQAQQAQHNLLRGDTRSTVKITLFEPNTPGAFDVRAWSARQKEKINAAFITSLHGLLKRFLGLITIWPTLLVLIVIGWVIWRRIKKWRQRINAVE